MKTIQEASGTVLRLPPGFFGRMERPLWAESRPLQAEVTYKPKGKTRPPVSQILYFPATHLFCLSPSLISNPMTLPMVSSHFLVIQKACSSAFSCTRPCDQSHCPPRPESKCPTLGSEEGHSSVHISFPPLTAYAVSSCSNAQSQLTFHGGLILWKNNIYLHSDSD